MEPLTLFVIIVVLVAGALGWRSGFIKQAAQVVGLIMAIAACRIFGQRLSDVLGADATGATSVLYSVLAYVILFLAIYIGVWLVGRLLKSALDMLHVGIVNRWFGAIFSICKWLLLISLLLNLWVAIWPDTSLGASPVYNALLQFGPAVLDTDTASQLASAVGRAVHG